MSREMTMEEFAAYLGRLAENVEPVMGRVLEWGQEEALMLALDYSYGPYSSFVLSKFDPPAFARQKRGAPALDPTVINIQTGRFASSWELTGIEAGADGIEIGVVNHSPEAAFLAEGTRYMFERPLAQRVLNELEPMIQARLEYEVEALVMGA